MKRGAFWLALAWGAVAPGCGDGGGAIGDDGSSGTASSSAATATTDGGGATSMGSGPDVTETETTTSEPEPEPEPDPTWRTCVEGADPLGAPGERVWETEYHHAAEHEDDRPTALGAGRDGSLVAVGHADSAPMIVAAYGPDRDLIFTDVYAGPMNLVRGADVTLDGAGNVFVAAIETTRIIVVDDTWSEEHGRLFVLKYAPDGTRLWRARVEDPQTQPAGYRAALAVDAYGAVTAGVNLGDPGVDGAEIRIVELNPSGTERARWEYLPAAARSMEFGDLDVDADGNLIVVGQLNPMGGGDHAWVAKFGPSRELLWDHADDVEWVWTLRGATAADGSVTVAFESGFGSDHERFIRRYDGDGELLWEQRIHASDVDAYSRLADLSVDCEGGIAVIGSLELADSDMIVDRLDADGTPSWRASYSSDPPMSWDYPAAVAVDPLGRVHAAGFSYRDDFGYDMWLGTFADEW